MTQRKPPGVRFESWVERQVREARDRGSFDDLPGTGRPLPPTGTDELAWVRDKARREGLPVTALLPPALAVAKEVEDLPDRLARERSERRVRALVEDVNARIDAARRAPAVGPPVRTPLLDVEEVVRAWQRDRQPSEGPGSPVDGSGQAPAGDPEVPARAGARRRWWRCRRDG